MFKQKLMAIVGSLIIIATMLTVSPVSATGQKLTYKDLPMMDDGSLNSLTLSQIAEITDSLTGLGIKELGDISKESQLKLKKLWQKYYSAEAESNMQKSLTNLDTTRSIPLNSQGLRSSTILDSANWGDAGGGGSLLHEWESSFDLSANRNNVWTDAYVEGYAIAWARNGVSFSTSPWESNEAHEVYITFDGYLGWWMTTMLLPGDGTFNVDVYLYDVTNQETYGSSNIYSGNATFVYYDTEDFSGGFQTTLWGDRDYVVYVQSYMTAFAFTVGLDPGYCQCTSRTTEHHTDWSTITLEWLN